jgi:hypothetical protein
MSNIDLINRFFERGLEGLDRENISKEHPNGTPTNVGGVKLWFEPSWKKQNRIFLATPLMNAVNDLPVNLYTLNRAKLDENGRVVTVPNGTGIQRDSIGLMLYTSFNTNDVATRKYQDKILQDLPELEGHVFVASQILEKAPNVKYIKEYMVRDQMGDFSPMRLEGCILLVLQSGSEEGGSMWGYRTKATTRDALNARTTASNADLGELA